MMGSIIKRARPTGGGLALAVVLTLCPVPSVFAEENQQQPDHDQAKVLLEAGEILPLEKILVFARSYRIGRVLEVELNFEEEHGGYVYEIKMRNPDGEVWEVEVFAATGDLIDVEHKN